MEDTTPPEWIVNDHGEIGVMIEGRCFFLHKGASIEYSGTYRDGTPMLYRPVGKSEVVPKLEHRKFISFDQPRDYVWVPLPNQKTP